MRNGTIPPGDLATIIERAAAAAADGCRNLELSGDIAHQVVKYLRRLDLWENELRARARAKELPKT